MGGSLDVSVGVNQTTLTLEVLSEFAPQAVELLADVLRQPLLPESELDRLKDDLIRMLSIQRSQPSSMALERFRQVLYGDHPYGRVFPTEEIIQSFTPERIMAFFETHYGALRSDLYVVGVFDEASAKTSISEAFGDWVSGSELAPNVPEPVSQRAIYLVDRADAHQSNLMMGLPVVDPSNPDYIPLLVTNTLLGGFFSSRITANIRENKGYTYSPRSAVSVRYRDAYWVQTANVGTDVTGPAITEILKEIEMLRDEPPSNEELEGVQSYMGGMFVLRNSSPAGIIGQLAFMRLHGLEESYLLNYVKNVRAVVPEEVSEMATKYIRPDDLTFVVVGDRNKVLEQVRGFGDVRD
jgi:predicted Zn-dependent peptidase